MVHVPSSNHARGTSCDRLIQIPYHPNWRHLFANTGTAACSFDQHAALQRTSLIDISALSGVSIPTLILPDTPRRPNYSRHSADRLHSIANVLSGLLSGSIT